MRRRRQSLPVTRRRTPSLEKSDGNTTVFEQPRSVSTGDCLPFLFLRPSSFFFVSFFLSRLRAHSLDFPGLTLLSATLNESREDKLDRLSRSVPFAERFSLAHFLDETDGDVEAAHELFVQRGMFLVAADGNVRRLPDSAAEDGSGEVGSLSLFL